MNDKIWADACSQARRRPLVLGLGAALLASGCLQDFDRFSAGEGAVSAAVGGGGAAQVSVETPSLAPSGSSEREDPLDEDTLSEHTLDEDMLSEHMPDENTLNENTLSTVATDTEASSAVLSDAAEASDPVDAEESADLWDAQAPVQPMEVDAGDAGPTEQEDPVSDTSGTSDPAVTECPASCDADRSSCDLGCSRDEEQCLLECSGGQGQCRKTCADARELCELDCLRSCDECYQVNGCAIACAE